MIATTRLQNAKKLRRKNLSAHPAIGAVLMSLSTVIVAINAQLLRRVTL